MLNQDKFKTAEERVRAFDDAKNLKPTVRYRNKRTTRIMHGLYRKNKRLFGIWGSMINRCENKNREKYKDYGGRGITVCKEWHEASTFVKWALANGYNDGLQLDRIDNNLGYSPCNCRWVTPKENSRNRRNTRLLTLDGETKSVAEWCETLPISQYTIYGWIREKGRLYAENRIAAHNRVARAVRAADKGDAK